MFSRFLSVSTVSSNKDKTMNCIQCYCHGDTGERVFSLFCSPFVSILFHKCSKSHFIVSCFIYLLCMYVNSLFNYLNS